MNETKPVTSSIVYKLSTWHLSQVFLSFFWINLILLLFLAGLLWLRAEQTVGEQIKSGLYGENALPEEPGGLRLPGFFDSFFPAHLQGAVRQVVITEESGEFWRRIEGLRYRVWVPANDIYHFADYNIGEHIVVFVPAGMVLLVFELFFLLSSAGKGARFMSRALQPIYDLTLKAKTISSAQGMPSDKQLVDLKGRIDNIDVTELDTRISVSSPQSELTDLTEAINGMLERVNNAYRSQIRFVSDASHELRTPIAVIQGYANLLDRWGKNDEKALEESIVAIKSEAENMKELVEQLLFLARGDNNSRHLSLLELNLSEVLSEVIRETEMIDPNHSFILKTKNDVFTVGDAQLIKQAMRIFIDNSVKYTPSGGVITANAFYEDDYAKIIIQDEGIGIAPADISQVFDRFFRSDDSRTRKTGGTGLGLAIAKWIVERHKGHIELLSRKDFGTRVTVFFRRQ
ncbi:MAG: sensor histidine kinase [Dethiobacteraceae bacterium]